MNVGLQATGNIKLVETPLLEIVITFGELKPLIIETQRRIAKWLEREEQY